MAHSTVKRYKDVLTHFINHCGPSFLVSELMNNDIQSFTLAYLQEHTKAGTNLALRHIKSFLRWSLDMGYTRQVPKITMLRIEEKGIHWLTREEYLKIYENAMPLIRDIMTLCVFNGCQDKRNIKLSVGQNKAHGKGYCAGSSNGQGPPTRGTLLE